MLFKADRKTPVYVVQGQVPLLAYYHGVSPFRGFKKGKRAKDDSEPSRAQSQRHQPRRQQPVSSRQDSTQLTKDSSASPQAFPKLS